MNKSAPALAFVSIGMEQRNGLSQRELAGNNPAAGNAVETRKSRHASVMQEFARSVKTQAIHSPAINVTKTLRSGQF
ncbi:hypothetical protein [Kaistia terrae]|jgi:hypothetical protein|uniref:Uncharacterized protein n=1 Tax=Kaistia terrae TaxID=537017 RepID=A0ABW0PSQ1_9HYPH|nr:hypothetical protein [Kaistia terrae]MCX5577514.1 hypothetical protein [Kaistia terrae]